MTDKIVLFDGSRKLHCDVSLGAIAEIGELRPLDIAQHECPSMTDNFTRKALNAGREQVETRKFIELINDTQVMQHYDLAGKLILVDDDLYSEGLNWCFGVTIPTSRGLGYVLLSTNRMKSENHAKDIIRHELGHMFGAPSEDRANTYENLGLHCSNDDCVMQQKLSVDGAVKYAERRARKKLRTYCVQCEMDIRGFEALSD